MYMAVTNVVKDGLEGTLSYAVRSVNLKAAPAGFTVTPADSGGTIADAAVIWYKVSTMDADGESLPCAAVSGTASTAGNDSSMGLSWSAVTGAVTYRIYISATQTGTYVYKASVTAPTVAYTDINGTVPATGDSPLAWVELAYCSGFSYEEADGSRPIYDHYTLSHFKRGRDANTASISSLYTNRAASVYELMHNATHTVIPCGIKLEIEDDGASVVSETITLFNAHITRVAFSQPDSGDDTLTADATYQDSDVR